MFTHSLYVRIEIKEAEERCLKLKHNIAFGLQSKFSGDSTLNRLIVIYAKTLLDDSIFQGTVGPTQFIVV